MSDADVFAEVAVAAEHRDRPVASGIDWRACGRREIDAQVLLAVAQDRVPAHAVAGREASTVDRRTHEGLAHARALGVQVVRRPLVGLVAEELHLALANLEQGIKDRAVLHELAGRVENRFVENLEAVAGLDFALEVHVEAEDVHHLHEDLVRHSRGERRVIEIGIDRADRPLQDALERPVHHARQENAVIGACHHDIAIRRHVEGERSEPRGIVRSIRRIERERERLTDPQPARIVNLAEGDDCRLRLLARAARPGERGRQRIPPANDHRLPHQAIVGIEVSAGDAVESADDGAVDGAIDDAVDGTAVGIRRALGLKPGGDARNRCGGGDKGSVHHVPAVRGVRPFAARLAVGLFARRADALKRGGHEPEPVHPRRFEMVVGSAGHLDEAIVANAQRDGLEGVRARLVDAGHQRDFLSDSEAPQIKQCAGRLNGAIRLHAIDPLPSQDGHQGIA